MGWLGEGKGERVSYLTESSYIGTMPDISQTQKKAFSSFTGLQLQKKSTLSHRRVKMLINLEV